MQMTYISQLHVLIVSLMSMICENYVQLANNFNRFYLDQVINFLRFNVQASWISNDNK